MPLELTFVPGTMCDRRLWAPVWRALDAPIADGRMAPRYIAVETRLTREAIRAAFDEAAERGPLNLIGFSMGGYLSLEYALDHPERVASLIVVCSSSYGLSEAEKAERAKVVAFLETHAYRGISTSRLNLFVHPGKQADTEVTDTIRAMDRDLGQPVLLAQMRETTRRASLTERLGALTCPTLLIGADEDRLVRWDHIAEMHARLPHSRLEQAHAAGHMLPLEQPDWLAARIADFHGLG
ncbi:MAG: alpha/beta hydrolase [Hyphomonadaceae bacterium]